MLDAINRRDDLLSRTANGERLVTTREILDEERRLLRFAVDGRGVALPLGAGLGGREGEPFPVGSLSKSKDIELNDQQKAAVEHVLTSRDRLVMLRGGAGTGKTTVLTEAAAAIEHGGRRVLGFAVTSDASRGVLREAGFRTAETLQKFLTDPRLQDQARGQVVWIDEAGMVGTPTMRKVCDLVDKLDARLVLSGDTRQHPPVERGDAMKLLETQAGIAPAELEHIVRQSGLYKQAVDALTKHDLTKAVSLLDRMDAIKETDGPDRHERLASRYAELTRGRRTALVVSPTHAEGRAVTGHIREVLRTEGRIGTEEMSFTRLQDRQWTEAQKADPHNYTLGQVIQFTRHCPGVPRRGIAPAPAGLKVRVVGIDTEKKFITTEDAGGHRRPLPLHLADRFGVFAEQDLRLSVGDRIRITRNATTLDSKHRLTNGSFYTVAGFTEDGHIRLDNKSGWVISKHTGHIAHGYCTTPQAAQGKSVDVCLAAMGAASMTASTLDQLYVVLSRGKKSVELHTDNRRALIDAVARLARRDSAIGLVTGRDTQPARRLIDHAREVARLRAFEQARWHRQHLARLAASRGQRLSAERNTTRPPTRSPRQSRSGPSRGGPAGFQRER